MAGIAGIIIKKPGLSGEGFKHSFESMMHKLSFSDSQLKKCFIGKNICFGNVVPLSTRTNDHYQHNADLGIYAVVDGLVFIDSNERSILSQKYDIDSTQSTYILIPFLYDYYKNELSLHVTGWFNIFVYDDKRKKSLLINDRLGFLPLFYYESDTYFIFASKIEAILSSELMLSVKPDVTSVAEHLFFNYTLSDYTYIENVHTLSNAEFIEINQNGISRAKYWSINEFYDYLSVDKHESFLLLNKALARAVNKTLYNNNKINLSLTGGWDSRVVLSYLLPHYKKKLNIYSFGAENSDDIVIPQLISKTEWLDYTPYILDKNYLDREFIPNALKTITLSNGTRNYKRTHYLYAIEQIADKSDILVTGNFGDEVFKVGRPLGGEVISNNMIDYLESDLDSDQIINSFSDSPIVNYLNVDQSKLIEEFRERLKSLKSRLNEFKTISQKYYSFRFEYNLRKYFGSEANSYNDFVFCFSPFIDYDFLDILARTKYFGVRYPFGLSSIRLKKQSTQLYQKIVQTNYKPLVGYNTSRGYSMKDANNLLGYLTIVYQKYIKSRKKIDSFNTGSTDKIFSSFLKCSGLNTEIIKIPENIMTSKCRSDLLSLFYWFCTIEDSLCKKNN